MMTNNDYRRLPLGVSDFEQLRRSDMYYVDKTMYLPLIEDAAPFLFFVRPRRFGKSLFASMMRAYYDKFRAKEFETLFKGLWIAEHPTRLQGQFQVLYLDCSCVGGTSEELAENFDAYGSLQIDDFLARYADDYGPEACETIRGQRNFGMQLNAINAAAKLRGIPLYLILDEYDNFTNTVLSVEGHEVYHAMTHATGFYRAVFKIFKAMFTRVIMIGVSPVTLDDLTSGYNIGTNISNSRLFDKMLGLSTSDVRAMITYYKEVGKLPASLDEEATIKLMASWYDNYCFARDCLKEEERVFNTNMTTYFMSHLLADGHAPESMIDPATRTDYAKMWQLLRLDQVSGDRQGVLRSIAERGEIAVRQVYDMFPAERIVEPEYFPSLLYYYGMLTLSGTRGASLILSIPNNNIRRQYYDYLLCECEKRARIDMTLLNQGYDEMALDGQWRSPLTLIAEAYTQMSSVRDAIEGERNIQGFFLAYLSLNPYILTAPEVELRHGFCDFFLLPDLTHYESFHSYILELKYLPRAATDEQRARQWDEAVEQIHGYAQAPRVEALRQGTTLHCIVMQFTGWDLTRMEEV